MKNEGANVHRCFNISILQLILEPVGEELTKKKQIRLKIISARKMKARSYFNVLTNLKVSLECEQRVNVKNQILCIRDKRRIEHSPAN